MNKNAQELVDNFALFSDWEERYAYLIDLGKKLPVMDDALKTDATLVPGCVSKVWMVAEEKDGKFYFLADSDAHIVRGLIAILHYIYNGENTSDISNIHMDEIFSKLGLDAQITPNRRNGFFAIVKKIQNFASV